MKTKNIIQNLAMCSFLLTACLCSNPAIAQIAVTTDGSAPDGTAMLDVKSTDKGMLMPRLTQAEIEAIVSPADGLVVYNTDGKRFYFFDGGTNQWKQIAIGTGVITPGGAPGCGTITDIDGNTYNTVQIGSQCWMKENLATTKLTDGSGILFVYPDPLWVGLLTPAYRWNYGTSGDHEAYGPLYNWYAVETGMLCPTGWHVPTDAEWTTLTTYLGGEYIAGKLKESGTEHWVEPNTGATNESNFTALPGSYGDHGGQLYPKGNKGWWWSSTENSTDEAWSRMLYVNTDQVFRPDPPPKNFAFSVRCLKD